MFVGSQDHRPGADTEIARSAAGGEHANQRRKGDKGLEALWKSTKHPFEEAPVEPVALQPDFCAGVGARARMRRPPRHAPAQRAQCPQSLQHAAPPFPQQASLPPWQQQVCLAQQPLPPSWVTQELRVSMATPEAATRSRFRMVFMVGSLFLFLGLCCETPSLAQGSLARYFAGFFSNLATQGLQQNLISCPS